MRHLDWNVLARLGQPVMKTYRDEEDLAVHVLLDCSASMSFGEPSKLEYAARIACALGYIALSGGDAVYPRTLGSRQQPLPALRGRASYPKLARWASSVEPVGNHSLADELKLFAASGARPGMAMIVTDGMDPDLVSGIRILGGRGHEVNVLQILSDIELRPDLEGDLRLLDIESASAVEITANSITMAAYMKRLTEHNDAVAEECRRLGGRYTLLTVGMALDRFVLDVLRRNRWVAA